MACTPPHQSTHTPYTITGDSSHFAHTHESVIHYSCATQYGNSRLRLFGSPRFGALRRQFDDRRLVRMRAAMAHAARMLDYGPSGKLAQAVLNRFERVASGAVRAVPASTKTPLAPLDLRLR